MCKKGEKEHDFEYYCKKEKHKILNKDIETKYLFLRVCKKCGFMEKAIFLPCKKFPVWEGVHKSKHNYYLKQVVKKKS